VERIFADDWEAIGSSDEVRTKAEVLEDLRSGAYNYNKGEDTSGRYR
jgi:hypothetical protein